MSNGHSLPHSDVSASKRFCIPGLKDLKTCNTVDLISSLRELSRQLAVNSNLHQISCRPSVCSRRSGRIRRVQMFQALQARLLTTPVSKNQQPPYLLILSHHSSHTAAPIKGQTKFLTPISCPLSQSPNNRPPLHRGSKTL